VRSKRGEGAWLSPAEFFYGHDVLERIDLGLEQVCQQLGLGHRDQHRGLAVGQDSAMAAHVVLELRETGGRVDRYRYAPCQDRPEKA
jgi:hypothetical protein